MFEDEPALAWMAMPYRSKVYGADGSDIGTAESLRRADQFVRTHMIVKNPSEPPSRRPAR